MANRIRIDQLAAEIAKAVQEYTEDVSEGIAQAVDQTAKEAVQEIEANSPRGPTKRYHKGWRIVGDDERGITSRIIWNPKYYRLVHLLEKGHAKRGGGRVAGKPHVGPAEQKYSSVLEQRVERVIKNGG